MAIFGYGFSPFSMIVIAVSHPLALRQPDCQHHAIAGPWRNRVQEGTRRGRGTEEEAGEKKDKQIKKDEPANRP